MELDDKPRKREILRTQHAQMAFDVAQLFNARFGAQEVSGYLPAMRAPGSESTAGGKHALQQLFLEPKNAGEATITFGQVNLVQHAGKLRTYECLQQVHASRFARKPFPLVSAAYAPFFDQVHKFLKNYSLALEIETQAPDMAPAPVPGANAAAAPSKLGAPALVGLVLLMVLAAVFAVLKITRKI